MAKNRLAVDAVCFCVLFRLSRRCGTCWWYRTVPYRTVPRSCPYRTVPFIPLPRYWPYTRPSLHADLSNCGREREREGGDESRPASVPRGMNHDVSLSLSHTLTLTHFRLRCGGGTYIHHRPRTVHDGVLAALSRHVSPVRQDDDMSLSVNMQGRTEDGTTNGSGIGSSSHCWFLWAIVSFSSRARLRGCEAARLRRPATRVLYSKLPFLMIVSKFYGVLRTV
jgi:hypothetical protein